MTAGSTRSLVLNFIPSPSPVESWLKRNVNLRLANNLINAVGKTKSFFQWPFSPKTCGWYANPGEKSPFYKNGYLWTGPKELILTDWSESNGHTPEISFTWLPNSARFTVTHTSEVNFLWYRNLKGMKNFSKKIAWVKWTAFSVNYF